jgi:hypothetical protein
MIGRQSAFWNKGKLIGAKPPLRPSHVWSIRTKRQIEGKKRVEQSTGALLNETAPGPLLIRHAMATSEVHSKAVLDGIGSIGSGTD